MLIRLRDEYWILGARRLCKAVKSSCIRCRRFDAPPLTQTMAPLPAFRVSEAPAFSTVGIDHAGPLYCSDREHKCYFLLFTCPVVRAVHLELVDSLSSATTLLALRRFSARRGLPSVIISDNAKGFVGAKKILCRTADAPEWRFIVPRAPWWGGFWERLVGTVKSALKKALGRSCLTRAELETLLHEIEAMINDRPLTFLGDDASLPQPLTPSHFLVGRRLMSPVSSAAHTDGVQPQDLRERAQLRERHIRSFWATWKKEYIRCLPTVPATRDDALKPGSVVLLQDDSCSRVNWPLAKVERLYVGRDGKTRSVMVKTCKGPLTRPIQRLHLLEAGIML